MKQKKNKHKLGQRMPIYDMVWFPGIKKENPAITQKWIKIWLSVLSALTIIFFMFIFFRIGWNVMENRMATKMESWKQRAIEAEKVRDDVEKAVEEIKNTRKKINDEEAYKLAVKYTASAYAFKIPVSYVLACAKMETEFNPDCVGPYDEREDFQIYKPSFAKFFPASEWHDRQKRYLAGLMHYAECVKIAQSTIDDTKMQLLLSLALHNSGFARRDPTTAFKAAYLHMRRAERLRIWELIEDKGLSV